MSRAAAEVRALGETSIVWWYVGFVEAMRPSEAFVRACDVSWRVEIRWCRVKSGVRRRSEAVRLVDPISTVGSAVVSLPWFLSCIFWLEAMSKSKSKSKHRRW